MDWQAIIILVLGLLLLAAGGVISRLLKEAQELTEAFGQFIQVVQGGLADGKLTPAEMAGLAKEWAAVVSQATDVWVIIRGIWPLIARVRNRPG